MHNWMRAFKKFFKLDPLKANGQSSASEHYEDELLAKEVRDLSIEAALQETEQAKKEAAESDSRRENERAVEAKLRKDADALAQRKRKEEVEEVERQLRSCNRKLSFFLRSDGACKSMLFILAILVALIFHCWFVPPSTDGLIVVRSGNFPPPFPIKGPAGKTLQRPPAKRIQQDADPERDTADRVLGSLEEQARESGVQGQHQQQEKPTNTGLLRNRDTPKRLKARRNSGNVNLGRCLDELPSCPVGPTCISNNTTDGHDCPLKLQPISMGGEFVSTEQVFPQLRQGKPHKLSRTVEDSNVPRSFLRGLSYSLEVAGNTQAPPEQMQLYLPVIPLEMWGAMTSPAQKRLCKDDGCSTWIEKLAEQRYYRRVHGLPPDEVMEGHLDRLVKERGEIRAYQQRMQQWALGDESWT